MQPFRFFLTFVTPSLLCAEGFGFSKYHDMSRPDKEPVSQVAPPFGHVFEPLNSAPSTEASRKGKSGSRLLRQLRNSFHPRRQSLWEGPWEYIVAALARPMNVIFMPGAIFGSIEAVGALQFDVSKVDTRDAAHLLATRQPGYGGHSYWHAFDPMYKCEDCIPQTEVQIKADHNGFVSIETLIALAWIGCIASSTLLVQRLGSKPIAKNYQIIGAIIAVVLLVCFFLFTRVCLFESARFDSARPLAAIECIYFMSQVSTTIGYGDIIPIEPLGKFFVGLAVFAAVSMASLFVSEVVSRTVTAAGQYQQSLASTVDRALAWEHDTSSGGAVSASNIWARPPKANRLVNTFTIFALFVFAWALFFHICPGERKSLAEAMYMSVVTLSTVGFGSVIPATDAGRVFAAFCMPLGTAALLSLVGALAEYVVGRAEFECYCTVSSRHAFAAFKKGLGGSDPTEVEFMSFALQQRKLCDVERIKELRRVFKARRVIHKEVLSDTFLGDNVYIEGSHLCV